jgi:mercuric transport protein
MTRSLLTLALVAALATPATAAPQTLRLFIPQMTGCPSCPYIVKSVLSRVDGVAEVEAAYATGIATIVYDDEKASLEAFRKALAAYGYDPERVTPES